MIAFTNFRDFVIKKYDGVFKVRYIVDTGSLK